MNITYTCPVCGTVQTADLSPGEPSEVPECSNAACTLDPAWGPISLAMMKTAVGTVIDGHPNATNAALAKFILRLLNKVRKMPACIDLGAAAMWQTYSTKIARR